MSFSPRDSRAGRLEVGDWAADGLAVGARRSPRELVARRSSASPSEGPSMRARFVRGDSPLHDGELTHRNLRRIVESMRAGELASALDLEARQSARAAHQHRHPPPPYGPLAESARTTSRQAGRVGGHPGCIAGSSHFLHNIGDQQPLIERDAGKNSVFGRVQQQLLVRGPAWSFQDACGTRTRRRAGRSRPRASPRRFTAPMSRLVRSRPFLPNTRPRRNVERPSVPGAASLHDVARRCRP